MSGEITFAAGGHFVSELTIRPGETWAITISDADFPTPTMVGIFEREPLIVLGDYHVFWDEAAQLPFVAWRDRRNKADTYWGLRAFETVPEAMAYHKNLTPLNEQEAEQAEMLAAFNAGVRT